MTRRVLRRRPETRRVRRHRLVAEDDGAVRCDAELELRVGEEDSTRLGVLRPEAIQLERGRPRLRVALLAAERRRPFFVDVLVVALRRLRRRGDDRLREARRLLESRRKHVAADGTGLAVVLPSRAGEIAAHDELDRKHLEPATGHGATVCPEREQVVLHDRARAGEPERRQAREDTTLVRDRRRQDDVERRDAVARGQHERLVVESVDLADLPAREMRGRLAHADTPSGTGVRRRSKTTSTCCVYAPRSNTSPTFTRAEISGSPRTRLRKSSPSSHARMACRCTCR